MLTRIFGIDFTSAPRNRKAITVAEARLRYKVLRIANLFDLVSLEQFSEFLKRPGPWIAAIDFPFGQPRKLVLDSGWPSSWQGYVHHVSLMGKQKFENSLRNYRDPETGRCRLLRKTDKKANSRSPMQLDFTPVGKMFSVGAPLLVRSPCTVVPLRQGRSEAGIVVEGYPKLVASKAVGKSVYKSNFPSQENSTQTEVRKSILQWIKSKEAQERYGFIVKLNDAVADKCLHDSKGDKLDAALCAMQAAWAWTQHWNRYGVPDHCDQLEGWIVDPEMLEKRERFMPRYRKFGNSARTVMIGVLSVWPIDIMAEFMNSAGNVNPQC